MEPLNEPLVWTTPMMISGIILVLTFVGIFTEGVHQNDTGDHHWCCPYQGFVQWFHIDLCMTG